MSHAPAGQSPAHAPTNPEPARFAAGLTASLTVASARQRSPVPHRAGRGAVAPGSRSRLAHSHRPRPTELEESKDLTHTRKRLPTLRIPLVSFRSPVFRQTHDDNYRGRWVAKHGKAEPPALTVGYIELQVAPHIAQAHVACWVHPGRQKATYHRCDVIGINGGKVKGLKPCRYLR